MAQDHKTRPPGQSVPLVAFAGIVLTLSAEADLTSLLAQVAAAMKALDQGPDDAKANASWVLFNMVCMKHCFVCFRFVQKFLIIFPVIS